MSQFHFSRRKLSGGARVFERALEILPGLTSWSILIGLILLSVFQPVCAAIIIIVFEFYWLLRLFYLTLFLMLSYTRLSLEDKTNWLERVRKVDDFMRNGALSGSGAASGWKSKISESIFQKELKRLRAASSPPPLSADIYHLVIVPILKETAEILEPSIQSFVQGSFSPKQIFVVLAVEERAEKAVHEAAFALQAKYGNRFFDFLIVKHPDGLEGEARVKGANASFAAKAAHQVLVSRSIAPEQVIVSCFDADTVVSFDYFACLTYCFMVFPDRQRASFQPIPVYHNNIWDVPGFARILETGASFFQLTEASHPDRLVTFSSHSMSFKALVEVGYWPVDMVSDDSAIFWKAFFHYDGDYRTVPMFTTLSMDVVNAGGWWQTCVSVYKQKRRWAWGVENFPIVTRGFLQSKKIPIFERLRHGCKLFEGHIAWATWPFILGVIGWLPPFFTSREFSDSVIYYTAPRISGIIFNLASVSLLTTIVLSLMLLPKAKIKYSFFRRAVHALEWLAIPLVAIFFSALPALEAQTRLMLAKYMEFWVSDKKR
ncbi:MAG TPA: glycosyltransferase family 2 protein [Candidatus Omnitrophota bacterium]|nr:glycosyltransferase family 2 protein [Candidatus Omnitrophota bacterium]